ncbi:elongator complex protein 5 [Fopius arisanus]|uniref:Elongator complex protein 5 n=1 Tax=Fopius arisanus TaxID=64838 RepID=A0A9R1T069_9HYME|nr:PREDICTED: elongator complex protein 5 [Fopius arisanus]
MVEIKSLPLLQDARFIVIDEGVEVLHGTDLVAGWLNMWKNTGSTHSTDLLLFSDPKIAFDHWTEMFGEKCLRVHDYYTQDIDDIYNLQTVDLKGIMQRFASGKESTVIINCLSSLILSVGLAEAARFVEKLGTQVSQLICIYRRDFGINRIPAVETLGSTYVRLDKSSTNSWCDINYEISVTHRKQGGGIIKHHVVITQDISTYEIKSEKIPVQTPKNPQTSPMKPQATFRLDMNSRELEQKNETPLPYIINNDRNSTNESKILYVPDDIDDLDEEDPDDDLPF